MTFSLDSYRALIQAALDADYEPVSFTAARKPRRALYLRHDVDYSLEMAVALARVNADLHVPGTFFVLLRGHSYNPLARKSLERLEELRRLGQTLGLHATAESHSHVAADFALLSDQAELDRVFSWHNPTPGLLERFRDEEVVDGLVNVYSRRFVGDTLYRSDSNFGRTYDQLLDAFDGEREAVHLLVHPINWVGGGESMLEVFEHAWPHLVREAELEARMNSVYAASFPDGMPEEVLTEFGRRWREAAG